MKHYILDGIKIYTGITEHNNKLIEKNINYNKDKLHKYYLTQNPKLDKNIYNFSLNDDKYVFDIYNIYQNIKNDIFTPLISSTITIKGSFSNILFNEITVR